MMPSVPLLLGAASCAALGILSRVWLPPAGAGDPDHQHLAATLVAIAWYVAAAAYGTACAMGARLRHAMRASQATRPSASISMASIAPMRGCISTNSS